MDPQSHWEKVYRTKRPTEVSWYRPHLDVSLQLIEQAASDRDAQVIDVGGGASTLVDDLVARGYRNVDVLDAAATAIEVARERLGAAADSVHWLRGDVTTFAFPRHRYDVWHDRAVFHFLTVAGDPAAYVRQVAHAVRPGGHVIVATFGPAGPAQYSGWNVARYDAEGLRREFGAGFRLVKHCTDLHRTPAGSVQQFVYCSFNAIALPGSSDAKPGAARPWPQPPGFRSARRRATIPGHAGYAGNTAVASSSILPGLSSRSLTKIMLIAG